MAIQKTIGLERCFFDGGLGTMLQQAGLAAGELPETWNLSHPEDLIRIHSAYLEAGCDIFNANTFGANRLKYPDNLEEIISAGIQAAMEARRRANRPDAKIALDIGPSGKLLEPMGDLSFEDAVSLFGEVVRCGAAAGADLVLIETMTDSLEAKAAVLAARENCDLPVWLTMVFDENGYMLTGGTPESMTPLMEGLGVQAFGINCSLGPEQMKPIAKRFLAVSSSPVIVNPNAGLPRVENGTVYYDITAEVFSEQMKEISKAGAHAVGGCCGTTPAHISAVRETCGDLPFTPPEPRPFAVITSSSAALVLDGVPEMAGRADMDDPDGEFEEALADSDAETLVDLYVELEDDADVLEVCVDGGDADPAALLPDVVRQLQGMTSLPLLIDSSDKAALAAAMRIYNGKPLVRTDGSAEDMQELFPLVQKYGASILVSPAAPETRESILQTAASFGIPAKELIFEE
ncbi:MAG: homocysteine S-methyltransferase family protein [Eubacterium sp.]|nr:homocysteine S-methyltransferase family protein [Eubacterium sp.]